MKKSRAGLIGGITGVDVDQFTTIVIDTQVLFIGNDNLIPDMTSP
jgi:hypothetical protein